ncbi:MAG: helix-turn-helix domain-containing protein [Luteitalea sp.]|nr:helix-turn-helix domain-containing protein [Luteitalea sp.]
MERAGPLIRRFGRLIHDFREEFGFTQAQLAARAGMSKKHLGDIERGDVEPSLSALECLARAFDMNLLELLAPVAAASRSGRPTLPLREWIRARDPLRALLEYADQLVSHTQVPGDASGPVVPTYRSSRRTRRPSKRRRG